MPNIIHHILMGILFRHEIIHEVERGYASQSFPSRFLLTALCFANFISFLGTNLLTQCPMPVAVFCLFLHHRKSISNGVQTPRNFLYIFMDQKTTSGPEKHLGVPRGGHNPPGCAWGPRRAQVDCAHLGGLLHPLFTL